MEVGAVKQAFNNELILLKKNLNQARIQIIHKLTRKAKTFVEKKAPEKINEKFKRKAEAAVKEVLIIKKIKPKDLAKFIVTHKGELQTYLNKPNVDQDKACARLLLHKSLQAKYKLIRERFSTVPIEDLLMSREERKKLKKEAKEKQKNKKKGKVDSKVVNSEGDWDVEDVEMPAVERKTSDNELSSDEGDISENEEPSDRDNSDHGQSDNESVCLENDNESEGLENDDESGSEVNNDNDISMHGGTDDSENEEETEVQEAKEVGKFVKQTPVKTKGKSQLSSPPVSNAPFEFKINSKVDKKLEKKIKDKSKPEKNKNLNDKLLSRKFKKDVNEAPAQEAKVVDPFFITSTGENYMSVAEPRLPDEVKEEHKQGNRKLRRAVMFGHVPKIKPRRDNFKSDQRFNGNNNGFSKNDSYKKFNNSNEHFNNKRNFTDKHDFDRNAAEHKPEKQEKLHPSWEAKKKQSGILPFQGKKIVFNES